MKDVIQQIEQSNYKKFIAELKSGYVTLGSCQGFKGHTVFLSKIYATELHQLEESQKMLFLQEMALVAECVWDAFKPDKLNYELLGNGNPHLHWHIFPRYDNDSIKGPVWWMPFKELRVELPEKELPIFRKKLVRSFKKNKKIADHLIRVATD